MLEVGVAVVGERLVAVVCVDGGVVRRTDDMGWCHFEVAEFVEPRGMFDTRGVDHIVWETFWYGWRDALFLKARLTHIGVDE